MTPKTVVLMMKSHLKFCKSLNFIKFERSLAQKGSYDSAILRKKLCKTLVRGENIMALWHGGYCY